MKISKDAVMRLLKDHPEADIAEAQLPDPIDTDDEDHANLLGKYGVNPGDLGHDTSE